MTDREAMRLALDALENHTAIKHPQQMHYRDTAIEALRQALEQPECNPHPDAPHGFNRDASHGLGRYVCDCEGWEPPTVSQELQAMPEKTDDVAQETQPEQEPVAWMYSVKGKTQIDFKRYPDDELVDNCIVTPLYTTPPKRNWVGLTDEVIDKVAAHLDDTTIGWSTHEFARAIEAKLKEKNHD